MSQGWFWRRGQAGGRDAAGTRGPVTATPESEAGHPGRAAEAAPLGAPVAADAAPRIQDERPLITIDALGRKCPIPIIMLAEQIRDVPVGAVIAVLADDPAAFTDIPAWAAMKSHECVSRLAYATGWSFGIRRSY